MPAPVKVEGKQEQEIVTEDNAAEIALNEFLEEKKKREERGNLPIFEKEEPVEEKPVEKEPSEEGKQKEELEKEAVEEKEPKEKEEEAEKDFREISIEEQNKIIEAKEKEFSEEQDEAKKKGIKEELNDMKQIVSLNSAETYIKTYAKDNNITEEDAKKEIESINKNIEKYGGDVKKISKAHLEIVRAFNKTQEQLKALREPSAQPIKAREMSISDAIEMLESGKITSRGKVITIETAVEAYRQEHPNVSEKLEDNAVLELVGEDLRRIFIERDISAQREHRETTEKEAEKRRNVLLEGLSENDKQYLEDIKPLLSKMPADKVLNDNFNLTDMIQWAKGLDKNYSKSIREAEERGYNKGRLEAKKILVRPITGPSGKGSAPFGDKGISLSEEEKEEALMQYPSISAEEAYKNYYEVKKDREKRRESLKNKK